ncbi:MAG TPA: carboxymuconolactone decarboxylase family protein [Acidimicrobiales bacterium]|nr:carboxymuconolactone decarboxylase family protein [Acidimicrobiales bacterium]
MTNPTTSTAEVEVPLPDDSAIRSVIGDSYDPESSLNVIKMFAGTEDMYPALIGMVNAIFETDGIDDKHREMIILRAATVLNAPYEWQANATMAANAGLTDQEIAAAASDGPVTGVDPEYILICSATDELSRDGTLKDATVSRLLDTFGDVLTRKYITTIAWFNMLSLFLNGCRVPLETTDKIGDRTSPLG